MLYGSEMVIGPEKEGEKASSSVGSIEHSTYKHVKENSSYVYIKRDIGTNFEVAENEIPIVVITDSDDEYANQENCDLISYSSNESTNPDQYYIGDDQENAVSLPESISPGSSTPDADSLILTGHVRTITSDSLGPKCIVQYYYPRDERWDSSSSNSSPTQVIASTVVPNKVAADLLKKSEVVNECICLDSTSEGSSLTSTSTETSPQKVEAKEPRRNPSRMARNTRYKKKGSDYVTEEDLKNLIESEDESPTEMVEEAYSRFKEAHPKVVVVKKWPVEGLHERPVYNEQTAKIEKFDFPVQLPQNVVAKVMPEKPIKLKVPKKKYLPKKKAIRKNNKKEKKKIIEMVQIDEILGVIGETSQLLVGTFLKNVMDSRNEGLHMCKENAISQASESEDIKDSGHSQCTNSYGAMLKNQCQLYNLCNEEIDYKNILKKWKKGKMK